MQHFYNDSFLLNTAVEALLSLSHQDHGDDEEQTSSEMIFQRRNGTDASPTGSSSRMKNSTTSRHGHRNHVSGIKMNPKKRKNSFKGANSNTAASKLSFPLEIFHVLNQKEMEHIISWTPDGKSFIIHNMQTFQNYILPHYFNGIKFDSFQRKLYRWGFTKNLKVKGMEYDDIYYTPSSSRKKNIVIWSNALFQRNKPYLCHEMTCSTVTPTNYSSNGSNSSAVIATTASSTNSTVAKNKRRKHHDSDESHTTSSSSIMSDASHGSDDRTVITSSWQPQ